MEGRYFKISSFIAWGLITLGSCCHPQYIENDSLIYGEIRNVARNGDIICRQGEGVISSLILKTLNDSAMPFSHCGIIYHDTLVIHSISDLFTGDVDGVQICPLRDFIKEAKDGVVAAYRYKNGDGDLIAQRAEFYLHQNIKFDWSFNNHDHNLMYCIELPVAVLEDLYGYEHGCSDEFLRFSKMFTQDSFEKIYHYR